MKINDEILEKLLYIKLKNINKIIVCRYNAISKTTI